MACSWVSWASKTGGTTSEHSLMPVQQASKHTVFKCIKIRLNLQRVNLNGCRNRYICTVKPIETPPDPSVRTAHHCIASRKRRDSFILGFEVFRGVVVRTWIQEKIFFFFPTFFPTTHTNSIEHDGYRPPHAGKYHSTCMHSGY